MTVSNTVSDEPITCASCEYRSDCPPVPPETSCAPLRLRVVLPAGGTWLPRLRGLREPGPNPGPAVVIEPQTRHTRFRPSQYAVRRKGRSGIKVKVFATHFDEHNVGVQICVLQGNRSEKIVSAIRNPTSISFKTRRSNQAQERAALGKPFYEHCSEFRGGNSDRLSSQLGSRSMQRLPKSNSRTGS
jgi:hypothetical protein